MDSWPIGLGSRRTAETLRVETLVGRRDPKKVEITVHECLDICLRRDAFLVKQNPNKKPT